MTTLRLRIDAPRGRRVLRFCRLPILIGRDATCDCRIDVPFASRVHARVDVQRGRIRLRDEGSRAGTFLRDRRAVPPDAWVDLTEVGYEFRIGPLRFRADIVRDREAPWESLDTASDVDSNDLETAKLVASAEVNALLAGLLSGPGAT